MKNFLSVSVLLVTLLPGLFAAGSNEMTTSNSEQIVPVESEIADDSPLVSVDWLKEHLSDENLVVIEVHSGDTEIKYTDEHIPGSVFASSVYFQTNPPTETNVPYDLPGKEAFQELARKVGVNDDSRIVIVYPGVIPKDVMCGTRTYWTFDYYGISDVSILDGGLSAWKREGNIVDNIFVEPALGNITIAEEHDEVLATLDEVIANTGQKGSVLLDSRMASDYIGTTKQDFIPEFGHITGSVNYFAALFLNPDMTFKSPRQITYEMSLLGVNRDKVIITYCNSGQFATTAWFALGRIAGMPNVSSFDGSVAEWVNTGHQKLVI